MRGQCIACCNIFSRGGVYVKKFKKTKPITTVEQFACSCLCNGDCYKRCIINGFSDYAFLQASLSWDTRNCEIGGKFQPW